MEARRTKDLKKGFVITVLILQTNPKMAKVLFCTMSSALLSEAEIPTFENAADVEDYIVRLIRAMNRHSKRIASYREFKVEGWQPRKSTQ